MRQVGRRDLTPEIAALFAGAVLAALAAGAIAAGVAQSSAGRVLVPPNQTRPTQQIGPSAPAATNHTVVPDSTDPTAAPGLQTSAPALNPVAPSEKVIPTVLPAHVVDQTFQPGSRLIPLPSIPPQK